MTAFGVFARTFPVASDPEDVAEAIASAGFDTTQLNLSVFGRPTLDETLDTSAAQDIRNAFARRYVHIWGVSGTFNAVHPDPAVRAAGVRACQAVIRRAPDLGAGVVTLCTGTRDAENMWHAHPDNDSAHAWADLEASLDALIPVAEQSGVQLGIEPESGNVIRDAAAADRLLRQMYAGTRTLTIVLDPANLLTVDTLADQQHILSDAFDLLGDRVSAMHAKDVVASGYSAPGAGGMDYDLVMRLHALLPADVPIIAQDLTADDASQVCQFLKAAWNRAHR
ncbi:MAG: sugar phosphate isomerase/epimerase [Actinomycetota bacterium]|nr:sugar phosphate isomerase/epimerase [Actinomycetota bacterium]